jgi:hypothetical protein
MIDPATGAVARGPRRTTFFLSRRIEAFAALGRVADDRTPPQVILRLPRTIAVRTLLARDLPLSLRSDEAAQVTVSLWLGGRQVGFGLTGRDTPGVFEIRDTLLVNVRQRAALRRAVGRRVRITISVNDEKGNIRRLVRTARLTR